jgi:hypothetical protein
MKCRTAELSDKGTYISALTQLFITWHNPRAINASTTQHVGIYRPLCKTKCITLFIFILLHSKLTFYCLYFKQMQLLCFIIYLYTQYSTQFFILYSFKLLPLVLFIYLIIYFPLHYLCSLQNTWQCSTQERYRKTVINIIQDSEHT